MKRSPGPIDELAAFSAGGVMIDEDDERFLAPLLEDDDVDSIGGLFGKALGSVPVPGARVEYGGLVLTGGTSRGRGRGLATVFVERSESLEAADAAFSPRTGEIRISRGSE